MWVSDITSACLRITTTRFLTLSLQCNGYHKFLASFMYTWREHRLIREVVTITQIILPWKPLTFPKNLKTFLKAILWKCLQKGEFVLNLQITGTIVQRLMTLTLVQYIILLHSTLLSSLAMSIWHIWYSIGANGCFWQMAENTLTREVVKAKHCILVH